MVVWNEGLALGIPSVDAQHRELVNAFNELEDAMRSGKGGQRVLLTLRFLGDYAVKHFSTEEGLMRAHRYPDLAAHRAEHEAFKSDFTRIMKEAETSEYRMATTMDVSHRLLEWLFSHIAKSDKRMGAFLVEKGAR